MATQHHSSAYDLSLFDQKRATVVPLAPNKKMKQAQKKQSRVQTLVNGLAILLTVSAVLTVVLMMIVGRVRMTEMNEQLYALDEQIAVLESENVRLNTELCEIASTEKVDAYAEKAGLQKIESYQIEYFTVDGGDRLETPSDNASGLGALWAKITG